MKKIILILSACLGLQLSVSSQINGSSPQNAPQPKEKAKVSPGYVPAQNPSDVIRVTDQKHEETSGNNNLRYSSPGSWSTIGPYNIKTVSEPLYPTEYYNTGRVKKMIDSDISFPVILTDNAGIWGYDPYSGSWNCRTMNFTTNIGDVARLNCNEKIWVAGTGTFFGPWRPGTGYYYSNSSGYSWSPASSPRTPNFVNSIAYSCSHDKLYSGASDGAYVSADRGLNWYLDSALLNKNVTKVFFENENGSAYPNSRDSVVYVSVPGEGLYWISINGSNHNSVLHPIVIDSWLSTPDIQHVEIEFNPSNCNTIYASVFMNDNTAWVYKSYNHGITWIPCLNPWGWMLHIYSQYCDNAISVDPFDTSVVVVGSRGMHRSSNGWYFSEVTDILHGDITSLTHAGNPGMFWVTCDGGICKYNFYDDSFYDNMNVLPIVESWDFSINRSYEEQSIILATQDNGLMYKTPGEDWKQNPAAFSDGYFGQTHPFSNDSMMGLEGATLFQTTDHTNWTWLAPSDQVIDMTRDYTVPASYYILTTGPSGNTVQKGRTVSSFTAVAIPRAPSTPSFDVIEFKTSTGYNPTYYIQTDDWTNQFMVKRPADTYYVNRTSALGGSFVKDIFPVYPMDSWIAVCTMLPNQLKVSFNFGESFVDYTGGLVIDNNFYVNDFLVNPYDAANAFIATNHGVYFTNDSGSSWNPYDLGLPGDAYVTHLDYIDNMADLGVITLVASVWGNSVWIRDVYPWEFSRKANTDPIASSSSAIELSQPYFDAAGNLKFDYFCPGNNKIETSLFNTEGKVINAFQTEIVGPGHYYREYPIGILPAGVYILTLRTESGEQLSRKIICDGQK